MANPSKIVILRYKVYQDFSLQSVPPGLSLNFNDGCVMKEAVEDGGGSGDIADKLAPYLEGTIGSHESGFDFVTAHNDFKEVFTGFGRELLDAHAVDDE